MGVWRPMMSNELSAFQANPLEALGFVRMGDTWFRDNSEIVQQLNFQKSAHGHQYFLNFGIWLKAMEACPEMPPKEHRCQIRARIGMIFPNEAEKIDELLDFEKAHINESERTRGINEFVKKKIAPLFEQNFSLSDIKKNYRAGRLENFVLLRSARDFLETD